MKKLYERYDKMVVYQMSYYEDIKHLTLLLTSKNNGGESPTLLCNVSLDDEHYNIFGFTPLYDYAFGNHNYYVEIIDMAIQKFREGK